MLKEMREKIKGLVQRVTFEENDEVVRWVELEAVLALLDDVEKELREIFNLERQNNADAHPHTFAVVVYLEKKVLGE